MKKIYKILDKYDNYSDDLYKELNSYYNTYNYHAEPNDVEELFNFYIHTLKRNWVDSETFRKEFIIYKAHIQIMNEVKERLNKNIRDFTVDISSKNGTTTTEITLRGSSLEDYLSKMYNRLGEKEFEIEIGKMIENSEVRTEL